jgi:hypothetical protein
VRRWRRPLHAPREQWRGPLSHSRRHGERLNCPVRSSVSHPPGFIFTSTGVSAEDVAAIIARQRDE